MKQQNKHIDLSAVDLQSRRFFAGGKFKWSKSHATVWSELDSFVIQYPDKKITYNFRIIQWAVAAVFILLIGASGFMRFYSKTTTTQAGSHLALILPDRSSVNLNAQSSLTYHPYWWRFERKLNFEGEGFFEVKKGNRFTVESMLGTTQVLGTSFNIYSRDEIYRVTCITGTVKVISKTNYELIIKPNCKVTVHPDGKINFIQNIETLPEISWKDNTFFFTSVPVRQVFSEIERQYGITINTRINNFTFYTGNFSRNQKVEEILGYICPALGYKYIHQSEKVYYIIPDEK
jgi:ferric-dicitrate binding protein FerR (iron transport regulator)